MDRCWEYEFDFLSSWPKESKTILKLTSALLLCVLSFSALAQSPLQEERFTFNSQFKFSLGTLFYSKLKINHTGKEHLKSYPSPSGEFTISYYRHLFNGYGVILGGGITIAPYNIAYGIEPNENTIFRTNDYYDYTDLRSTDFHYDEAFLTIPISVHKAIAAQKRTFTMELGVKVNVLNLDPEFLPGTVNSEHEIGIEENDSLVFYTLLNSYTQVNGGISSLSYFTKFGIMKILKNHSTLEYQIVANLSPRVVRTGEFEFFHLGYESEGTVMQRLNHFGFVISYGFTLGKRLAQTK